MNTLLAEPRDTPATLSARPATVASLPMNTGMSSVRFIICLSGTLCQKRLVQNSTTPLSGWHMPGTPTPMAFISAAVCPVSSITCWQRPAISPITASAPRSTPVGREHLCSILPSSSTRPAAILVPPRSTPMYNMILLLICNIEYTARRSFAVAYSSSQSSSLRASRFMSRLSSSRAAL